MTSKSKNKGNSFERDIAKYLSELYQESFVRVPSSGAYIGKSNSFRKDSLSDSQIRSFKGDIIPGDSFPYLVLELKNYADFPFHSLLSQKTIKKLDTWILQVESDCDGDDIWLLLIKISNKGQYVVWNSLKSPYITCAGFALAYRGSYRVMPFNQFFHWNKEKVAELSAKKDLTIEE